MNCRDIEPLLLTERDGVLTTTQHTALEGHVATCPACRQMRDRLAAAMATFRSDVAKVTVPDVDEAWRTVRAQLHGNATQSEKKRPLATVIWFGAPVAAAAAIAFALFAPQNQDPESESLIDAASAEFVEAGNADASTMVYVDKESGWLVVWATDNESDRSI